MTHETWHLSALKLESWEGISWTISYIFTVVNLLQIQENFFVNRVIFVEKPVAALLLNADIVAGNAARQWLAGDSSKPRIFARCEKQGTRENGCLPPRNLVQEPKNLENLKKAVQFRFIRLILAAAVYVPVWHTAQELGSLFRCHALVSLRFTHVRYFAHRWLQSLWADCSIVTLYWERITWQQTIKGSLQVTVEGLLPHVVDERGHLWQKMLRDSDCW